MGVWDQAVGHVCINLPGRLPFHAIEAYPVVEMARLDLAGKVGELVRKFKFVEAQGEG